MTMPRANEAVDELVELIGTKVDMEAGKVWSVEEDMTAATVVSQYLSIAHYRTSFVEWHLGTHGELYENLLAKSKKVLHLSDRSASLCSTERCLS